MIPINDVKAYIPKTHLRSFIKIANGECGEQFREQGFIHLEGYAWLVREKLVTYTGPGIDSEDKASFRYPFALTIRGEKFKKRLEATRTIFRSPE